ncbi:chaplin [Streptomyces sp. E11-3]|uniref:chaplin n=1 Tax=Streptomyces sp. E11-3 TaxID=3110112 RepID=UPI0039804B87
MSRIAKAAAVTLGTGAVMLSGAGMATADAGAEGKAVHSPGVLSGNLLQVPVHVPINVCGNTVNGIAGLNPAFGNTCANVSDGMDNGHHDNGGHDDNGGDHVGYGG